jgi:hypothetical protein
MNNKVYLETLIIILKTTTVQQLSELLEQASSFFNWCVEFDCKKINRITHTADMNEIKALIEFAKEHKLHISVVTPIDDQSYGAYYVNFPPNTDFLFYAETPELIESLLTAPHNHTRACWVKNFMIESMHPRGFDDSTFINPEGLVLDALIIEFDKWNRSYSETLGDYVESKTVKEIELMHESMKLINPKCPLIKYDLETRQWFGIIGSTPEIIRSDKLNGVNRVKILEGAASEAANDELVFSELKSAAASMKDDTVRWFDSPIVIGYLTMKFEFFEDGRLYLKVSPTQKTVADVVSEEKESIIIESITNYNNASRYEFFAYFSQFESLNKMKIEIDKVIVFETDEIYKRVINSKDQDALYLEGEGEFTSDKISKQIGDVAIRFIGDFKVK